MDSLDLELVVVDTKGMLIGSWFVGFTYGILLLQLGLYIRAKAADPIILKLAVGLIFLMDTTWTILFLVSTYHQLINVSPTSLDIYVPPLTFIYMPMLGATSFFVVNLFLVWRYTRLTQRKWLSYGLYSFACATFACYMYSISLSVKLRKFDLADLDQFMQDYNRAGIVAKTGISLEVVMVCTIWILLLVTLIGYLRKEMMGTRRLVIRLVLITAETGTVATIMCVAQLVYILKNPSSANSTIIAMFTSRVYYMSMMFTLNMRGNGGQVMQDATSGRRSGAYGASNSLPLSHISSSGTGPSQLHKVVHVSQDVATGLDKQEQDLFGYTDGKSQAYQVHAATAKAPYY